MVVNDEAVLWAKIGQWGRVKICPFRVKNGLGVTVGVTVGVTLEVVNTTP